MQTESKGGIVWLASYPKSGNTWMRMLLAHYFNETDVPHDINAPGVTNGIASSRARFDELLGISSSDLTDAEAHGLRPAMSRLLINANAGLQWIKAHDAQQRMADGDWLLPPDVSIGAVYLVRDPRDVAVSRAYHDGHQDMDRAVAFICNPDQTVSGGAKTQLRQYMGDWSHHVRSWLDDPGMPVLLVRYEDMLADTAHELRRVLSFAMPDQAVDADRIAAAVAGTAFETLQKAEAENGFRERTSKQERFFRNGKAGDWRNHLTPDQAETICNHHRAIMDRLGYDPN